MNFQDALISAYCENPCQVLPNALWKTLVEVENLETSFEAEGNVVTHLEAWGDKKLSVYWDRNRTRADIPHRRLVDLDFAIIHQDFLHAIPIQSFTMRKAYFRLIHKTGRVTKIQPPNGFGIVNVDGEREAKVVANLIKKCYDNLQPSEESVKSWMRHPVFDSNLWIWMIDENKGIPVGLGIAEIDSTVSEGSLEWIQVLPAYRGRGIGKSIVLELLSRLQSRVRFTTVAGEVNLANPETLYRICGFQGGDIWWLLRNS